MEERRLNPAACAIRLFAVCFLTFTLPFSLLRADELPEPLSLEQALQRAELAHPELLQAGARRDSASAELLGVEAEQGLEVYLQGRARWVETSDLAGSETLDDHKLALLARKPLYDFGHSQAREEAAEHRLLAEQMQYHHAVQLRRLLIMERFFAVLLADMQFAYHNEAMATAYVTLDRLRTRYEMGQVSDIQLLEQEQDYQQVRRQRLQAELAQRSTRSALALQLNSPGKLPSKLLRPDAANAYQRALPDYAQLIEHALSHNRALLAMRKQAEAAQAGLLAADRAYSPKLDLAMEAAAYSRETLSTDKWRAGLQLQWPLYSGGRAGAASRAGRIQLQQAQSRELGLEYELRQRILELWQELSSLQVLKEESEARIDYQDLYLERSRAAYDSGMRTDLGDAMVRLTYEQLEQARREFAAMLAWTELELLMGGEIPAGQSAAGGETGDETGQP